MVDKKNSLKKLIKKTGKSNIKILSGISNQLLLNYYQKCRALICPQEEDFGLTPLEAQACGKPVIAYNKGGFTETILNKKTGLFFENQTIDSLCQALKEFENIKFNPKDCIDNANRFSSQNFMLNFKQAIIDLWHNHQNKTIIY